jgi:iron(III) transport system substrate-binding protein
MQTGAPEAPSGTILLYTSVQQTTIDPVLLAFAEEQPDVDVELFRAPTGELTARITADLRDQGRIGGDVLWLSDPLSAEAYDADGHLRAWSPSGAAALDDAYVTETYWGTRLLNMVIAANADADRKPTGWADLVSAGFRDAVALPDPAFAGSAFGALGYFAGAEGFGMDWYRDLAANGATQLQAPDEVTTGVAEGQFAAGMTLDFSVRAAAADGSPVELIWPEEGAVAIYSPVAVVDATEHGPAAEAFVEFLLSDRGQAVIGDTGWQPALAGAGGPASGGDQVQPDWTEAAGRQEALLEEYASIFGG